MTCRNGVLIGTLGVLATAATLSAVGAEDWPEFLGEGRKGSTAGESVAASFPKSGPKTLWTTDTGPGFGGAAIVKGKVYLFDREDDARDVLRCLALDSGKELWRQAYEAPGRLSYNGSRHVPTVTGDSIVTCGPFGHLTARALKDGKLRWQNDLCKDFGARPPKWGYASSPLVTAGPKGPIVIAAPMARKAGLVAYDLQSGELVWKTGFIGDESYVSPALYEVCGETQVLFFARGSRHPEKGLVTALEPKTGKVRWQWDKYYNRIPIPPLTALGEDRFFLTGGYDGGSVIFKVTKSGDSFTVKEQHRWDRDGSQIHQAVLIDGKLYANFNRNENLRGRNRAPNLVCLDPATGKTLWSTDDGPELDRGPILAIGKRILALGGETGILHMIKADPKGFKELGRAKVFPSLRRRKNMIWAPLALADGRLVVRSQRQAVCLDLRGANGK